MYRIFFLRKYSLVIHLLKFMNFIVFLQLREKNTNCVFFLFLSKFNSLKYLQLSDHMNSCLSYEYNMKSYKVVKQNWGDQYEVQQGSLPPSASLGGLYFSQKLSS